MYKLMIVTDSQNVVDYFENLDGWVSNGFKKPHYRSSQETLVDGMSKHHVDGMAIQLSSEEETIKVINYLNEYYPIIPIFEIKSNYDDQAIIFTKLRKLLDNVNADYADDSFSKAQRFEQAKNKWFHKYLTGKISNHNELSETNKLMRTNILIDKPCALVDISIPSGEEYMSNEWHYGSERLEVALRNFFGYKACGANVIVAVTSQSSARLLIAQNVNSDDKCTVAITTVSKDIRNYIDETLDNIEQYLGLKLEVSKIESLPNLISVFEKVI